MISSLENSLKDVNFSLKPSAKELTEMDILCFISSWSEKDYIEMQNSSFFNSWILEIPDIYKIGFLAFNVIYEDLEILRLGIHPFWRRKGLAKFMLERLEQFSTKRQLDSIFLEVHVANFSAISLYRKKGYKEIGRRKKYFKNPIGDALLLKKLL